MTVAANLVLNEHKTQDVTEGVFIGKGAMIFCACGGSGWWWCSGGGGVPTETLLYVRGTTYSLRQYLVVLESR